MDINEPITEVMFRKFRGEITALFPYEIEDRNGSVMSYAHVGQHSGAVLGIIYSSKPAKENEYFDLFIELTNIGYNLKVIQKVNYKRYNEARKLVK